MSTTSYYQDQSFINTGYALNIALETYFADLLFFDDLTKIVYSSDSFAFRRRAKDKTFKNANLPFMNYKLDNFDFGSTYWWSAPAHSKGIYISELGQKIRYSPVTYKYEATFWCHRDDELRYAFQQLRFQADNKTTITAEVDINGITLPFSGQVSYTNLQYDPQFNEQDWLERNKIHNIKLDFEVLSMMFAGNSDITLTKEVCFNFMAQKEVDLDSESTSFEQTVEYVVDHFNETVTEKE